MCLAKKSLQDIIQISKTVFFYSASSYLWRPKYLCEPTQWDPKIFLTLKNRSLNDRGNESNQMGVNTRVKQSDALEVTLKIGLRSRQNFNNGVMLMLFLINQNHE